MRIAFYANHGKTYFFARVGEALEARGHRVSWISPGRRLSGWLRARGVPSERVLDLTASSAFWKHPWGDVPNLPELLPGPMQLNAMIQADRFLRERPHGIARRYLAVCGSEIVDFCTRGSIDVVLGEQTYALELLSGVLLRQEGIPFLAPATVRIPSSRFGLFESPFQDSLATSVPVNDADRDLGLRTLTDFIERPSKPHYFAANQGPVLPHFSWLASPFKQLYLARIDPDELNRPSLGWLLRSRVKQVAFGQAVRACPFSDAGDLRSPYVLLTLHRQPEASIDVLGFRYADQLAVIRAIASSMPNGWTLAVKEHSNGLGDRSPAFYRQVRRVPGVTLVDPWADSLALARSAVLTLTISGTIAFEASLAGLPAATLVPMYFGPMLLASGLNPYSGELEKLLRGLVLGEISPRSEEERAAFMGHLMANSAPGLIGAPDDTPDCMSPHNISMVAAGIEKLLPQGKPTLPDLI